MEVRPRLREIFIDVFSLDGVAPDTLEYRGIEQWDSVGHMALVAEIEDTFDVMLETDEVLDMSSFDKAVEIVEKHTRGQSA